MKKLLFIVSSVLLFCLVVYGQQIKLKEKPKLPVSTTTEINAINELFTACAKAFEAKDADRICSFLTDDFVYPYGGSLLDKKGYRELLIKGFSEGVAYKIYLPDKVEVSASGDLAYAAGYFDFTVVTKGEAKTTKGCTLYVFKKQKDGSWKIASLK